MDTLKRRVHEVDPEYPHKPVVKCEGREGFFYQWVNPLDPKGVERRLGDLYWNGWSTFVLGFALTAVGMTFFFLSGMCLYHLGDVSRTLGLLCVSVVCILPGVYSLVVLWYFICGKRGYSYEQLMSH